MRTATLLACVGTWLVSLVSTVQAGDYKCGNGAVIPKLQSPGHELDQTPEGGLIAQLYWREILHMDPYYLIDNVQYSYRVVFDSDFDLISVEAVTLSGSQSGTVLNCQ